MKKRIYIIILCSLVIMPAASQTVMTLHDCMAYAISHSTKIQIHEASADDARIARRDAALQLFTPYISASTYAYYNFGRSIDPQTNTYFNTTSFHNSYSVSAGYDLFDGLQAVNNYRISKTGMLIADSQAKQAEADICLAVMEAYYNVVYYMRLSDIYREQVTAAEDALRFARRAEELGTQSHLNVIQLEADLIDRQYDLASTENALAHHRQTLADLMFFPIDEDLQVDTTMYRDAGSVLNGVPFRSSATLSGDALSAKWQISTHFPRLQLAEYNVSNAERELSTARWQVLPTIRLYAGWNTSYYKYKNATAEPFGRQFVNHGGEYVQLSLSLPLWDRMARASRITRKKNALKKANAELEETRREVLSEMKRAIQDRDAARLAHEVAQRKAAVQTEAYMLSRKQLEQGLISPLEFQTANNNYLRALSDEMNSRFQYLIKMAVVEYYNGTEYINQSTTIHYH